ncbi:MAG: multiheme c-type cytochrome [Paracoccaceae bacterium]
MTGRISKIVMGAGLALGLLTPGASAHDVKALGATTCGQATCHSAETPWPNSSVTQREYVTWKARDPHAKSFQTLQTKKATAIARDLGYRSATSAKLCLDCHTFNISPKHREETFNQAEGVTCEACHGPASEWIGVHQAGLYFYQRNVDEGMYPTTEPTKRAELCLSCHMGTSDKFVSHRMFVAGHPRLPFELGFYSWFSEATPGRRAGYSHFQVDDDYLQRKPWPFGVKVWAVGQAMQMKKFVELMTDPDVGQEGLFPEFAFFECHSCHNATLDGKSATSRTGVPRINDANAYFVQLAASMVDKRLAGQLQGDIAGVRAAAGGSWEGMRSAANQLKRSLTQLVRKLEARKFSDRDTRYALNQIAAASQRGVFTGYYEAEQAVLAAGSLVDELDRLEALGPGQAIAAQKAIANGMAAFKSIDRHNAGQVRAALNEAARLAR